MYIDYLYLNNFTVFKTLNIEFSKGLNIFIGENGTGKTHLLKLLYAACKAAEPQISFPQKLVNCMLPDNYKISRLVNRDAKDAKIVISAEEQGLEEKVSTQLHFSKHNKKWNATVDDEEEWEQKLNKSNAIFIPAKEILSNCYNLGDAGFSNLPLSATAALSLLNGDAKIYDAELTARDEYLTSTSDDEQFITVPALSKRPAPIFHSDITDDAGDWHNAHVAMYYRKECIWTE